MSEKEVIARTRKGPVTVASLAADLRKLGVSPGMVLLVHSSLSSIGWVCGGAASVVLALERVLKTFGTLVMPAHSGHLSDPSFWENPSVPKSWWETIRKSLPAYDAELTLTRGMGAIPECFRKQNNVLRSCHPQYSFAAWGEQCFGVVQDHDLDYGLGEGSPLARIYDLDGWVLLLGVDHGISTSLHLAEYRACYTGKKTVFNAAPLLIDSHRRWKKFRDINLDSTDFLLIGRAFCRKYASLLRTGFIAHARTQLLPQRPYVDFAVKWMERNRK